MGRGVNKVILIGNLGRDPETRVTPDGLAITTLALATSDSWKDKQSGEKRERTEWHRVVMYRGLAEMASKYLKKGSKLYIEGRVRTSKWQDKTTGADRYSTDIVADEMSMLDSSETASSDSLYPPSSRPALSEAPENIDTSTFDDDIPF